MEKIEHAVERARAKQGFRDDRSATAGNLVSPRHGRTPPPEFQLNTGYLQSNRIVAHLHSEPEARAYDMLRTQVLQAMDQHDWKVLGITSPTPNCGKTVTAVNLAISIAHKPERSALLVDLDFHKPKVATYLGLNLSNQGVRGIIEGTLSPAEAVVSGRISDHEVAVLHTAPSSRSSALTASPRMTTLLQSLRKDYFTRTIIVDLPPILTTDDVISILPNIDCVLLVAAVGSSTVADIEECGRHLQSTEVIRVVLNKVPEASSTYYYSGY